MTARRLSASLWVEAGCELAEGPVWDARARRLSFVDILSGRLHRVDGGGRLETLAELDRPLGAALPSQREGEYLLVTREGFRIRRVDGTIEPLLGLLDDRPDLRFNDAKCDSRGRCLAGTLSMRAERGQGTLFRLDDGPAATAVLTGVGLSNGLGWSPEGTSLYFADTDAGAVTRHAYDPDSGTVGPAIPFVSMPSPDGLCVDESGAVWVASWDGGRIDRYTPDARLDTVVELPVPHVTSCAFMGDTLVITTARGSGPVAAHAGDLFVVEPGVGAPEARRWRPVGA